jgi:steroid 5-alpha reductase family enzyme
MEKTTILKDPNLWVALTIILVTTGLSVATFLRWFNLRFQIGPYYFTHWLSWIGTLFIAIYTPIYYVLKRRNPKQVKTLIKVHMFGNLLAVMLISIHYAQQMGRPAQFYPELGTGLALYIVMFILVATGFFHRFKFLEKLGRYRLLLPHQNRYLHIAITLTFYLVIIVHALRNVGLL